MAKIRRVSSRRDVWRRVKPTGKKFVVGIKKSGIGRKFLVPVKKKGKGFTIGIKKIKRSKKIEKLSKKLNNVLTTQGENPYLRLRAKIREGIVNSLRRDFRTADGSNAYTEPREYTLSRSGASPRNSIDDLRSIAQMRTTAEEAAKKVKENNIAQLKASLDLIWDAAELAQAEGQQETYEKFAEFYNKWNENLDKDGAREAIQRFMIDNQLKYIENEIKKVEKVQEKKQIKKGNPWAQLEAAKEKMKSSMGPLNRLEDRIGKVDLATSELNRGFEGVQTLAKPAKPAIQYSKSFSRQSLEKAIARALPNVGSTQKSAITTSSPAKGWKQLSKVKQKIWIRKKYNKFGKVISTTWGPKPPAPVPPFDYSSSLTSTTSSSSTSSEEYSLG